MLKTEKLFQAFENVKVLVAVRAALQAGFVAQVCYDALDFRVIPQHPGWRRGKTAPAVDDGQSVSQFDGVFIRKPGNICLFTNVGAKFFKNQCGNVRIFRLKPQEFKKGGKRLLGLKQTVKNHFQAGIEARKCRHFVVKQVPRFQGVVERVVDGIGLELIVLDQGMVGFLRKKQGRPRQGINGVFERNTRRGKRRADEFQIMLKNVVPANKIRSPKKQCESLERSIVKLPAIVQAAPDVEDFFAVAAGFRIEKGYGGHTGSIPFPTKLQRRFEFRFI